MASPAFRHEAVCQSKLQYRVAVGVLEDTGALYAVRVGYAVEQPLAKRFIRKKLNRVNELQAENERLREEIRKKDEEKEKQQKFLKRLATEYVIMGKECEKEGMKEAAIMNYRKALTLYPEHPEAKKRLLKVKK